MNYFYNIKKTWHYKIRQIKDKILGSFYLISSQTLLQTSFIIVCFFFLNTCKLYKIKISLKFPLKTLWPEIPTKLKN